MKLTGHPLRYAFDRDVEEGKGGIVFDRDGAWKRGVRRAKSTGLSSKSSPLLREEIMDINGSFMTARGEITKSGECEPEDVEQGFPWAPRTASSRR
jgi:hypothetical protein